MTLLANVLRELGAGQGGAIHQAAGLMRFIAIGPAGEDFTQDRLRLKIAPRGDQHPGQADLSIY